MPAVTGQKTSPDALLALANKEQRGKLKIFLGAAPGVGKTYAMLLAAQAEKASGRDVAIGLVETHGRQETEGLLKGFEIIPRKSMVYSNRMLEEFDIDAALARRPGLLLVDELAHTNIPGSRHPKRWQDIKELLNAKIDVWTTLNVQHLESLNDVIQKITHVQVRETVPDRIFDEADEIVLVDLPPDELLKRLAQGKIYVQDTAARATESFFKPQNLTALRELALRRAAERVDSALVERMQANAIEGPWAAGERILACVGPDVISPKIVRAAKRLSDLMDAPWMVVTIERPDRAWNPEERRRIDDALNLAESLGADIRSLIANDFAKEILRVAKFENVTQIVIGRSPEGLWNEIFRRSLPHELIRCVRDIPIHLVTSEAKALPKAEHIAWASSWRPSEYLAPSLWSAFAVFCSVGLGKILTSFTPLPNLSMIFLMAVLFSAVTYGVWPAVVASILSFLAYNFFFIEPIYTFTVSEPHELFALVIFLLVAVMISALAGRVRHQARTGVDRIRAMRRLYEFTRRLSTLTTVSDVTEIAAADIYASLNRQTVILLGEDGDLALKAAWPPEDTLDAASMSAARWAYIHGDPAGFNTSTLPAVQWYFIPLRTPRNQVGVIGISQQGPSLDAETQTLLDTLAEQTAVALERSMLTQEMVQVKTIAETERVRNTLLASISHDFRTPLASIMGSATSVLEYGDKLKDYDRKDLLNQIRSEAESLDQMVRNLLAVTRIDAGNLELRWEWVDLREIVERVVSTVRRRGASQSINITWSNDLPLIHGDAALIEQAIGNVIGNAVIHTLPETQISIQASADNHKISLCISDNGPGIYPESLPYIFEKFVRGREENTHIEKADGTGLGLTIAKGIMEAHGGSITVQSSVDFDHGATFTLIFPRVPVPS